MSDQIEKELRSSSGADLELPALPLPRNSPPLGRLQQWLFKGGTLDTPESHAHGHRWYQVLWLTGVDYFSTLGYQPGIALAAAGALSPLATLLLVLVTLGGVLPVYAQVTRRSYAGQGSIAMLENMLPGWGGKIFVLVLLGFATTDFIITMTLSAADAATHAIENPFLHPLLGEHQVLVTLVLLALLAGVFLLGFREAIGVATALAIPYLLLNAVVIVRGLLEIAHHPARLEGWKADLAVRGDFTALLIASAFVFPKLALGMSGFETGVAVMPQVADDAAERHTEGASSGMHAARIPWGRIRGTQKLLATAALLMSVLLLGSSFVSTLLVTPQEVAPGGPASGRVLSFLAHRHLGHGFGSLYDLVTIAILWFAGASAMAGMLNLVPRYLPRFGMAPRWVAFQRPLVLVLFAFAVVITLVFQASVEAQGGAYATGVLVLMLSAAIAVALALWRENRRSLAAGFWLVTAVLGFTLADNVIERSDGVLVATAFILVILVLGAISRWSRSSELRVERMFFADPGSKALWPEIRDKKVHLVPLRSLETQARERKLEHLHRHYKIEGPVAFLSVRLLDNRSEFVVPLELSVRRLGSNYDLQVDGAVAVANSIAYLSELIDPIDIFLDLTRENPMTQSLRYVLLGEGEVGLLVYTTLLRYWRWTPEDDVRPLIHLMSD